MSPCRGWLFWPRIPAGRQMMPVLDSVLTKSLEKAAGRKCGPCWGLRGKHHMHAVPDPTWLGFHQQGLAKSTSSRRSRLLTAWLVTCWSRRSTISSSGTCILLITITTVGWVPSWCCLRGEPSWAASEGLRNISVLWEMLTFLGALAIFHQVCHFINWLYNVSQFLLKCKKTCCLELIKYRAEIVLVWQCSL